MSPGRGSPAATLAAAALLPLEVLLLTLGFEPARRADLPGWAATALANAAVVPRLAIAFAGTLMLILSTRLAQLRQLFDDDSPRRTAIWVVANLVCYLALYQQTATAFAGGRAADLLWWVGLCIAVSSTWALGIAPAARWRGFLRSERVPIAASLACALGTWAFSVWVQHAWRPLAEWTLFFAQGIIRAVYSDASYDAVKGTVGTSRLTVEIAPECAGYEGLALITLFVATYLLLFRERLSFPRALWLFPAGWIAMWLANVVRIAAIVVVGTSISPAVAIQGFHSQAGWIAFTAIGLALVWLSHRSGLLVKAPASDQTALAAAMPLLLPFIVMLATSMLAAAFSAGFDALYPVMVVATATVLLTYRAEYRALPWSFSPTPIAIGVAVYAAWMVLVDARPESPIPRALAQMPAPFAVAWVVIRVLGSVIVVPLAEELAFRGYLLRKLVDREFERVPPGCFTWVSFLASSMLFGLLHANWIAGAVAGAGFALALYRRGRLTDAIVAHMVANALIAATVLAAGRWSLWG